MNQQTQAFLALLSNEMTVLVFDALKAKPLSTTELAKVTESDPRVLGKHLETLKLSALVRSYRVTDKGPGRPRIYWALINDDAIDELSEFVAGIRHRLIDTDPR